MIISIGEHVEAKLTGGVRQIMTVVNVKNFMRFGAASFGCDVVYPVVRFSRSFLVRQDVTVKVLHKSVFLFDMLVMHGVGVGDQHGPVSPRQFFQKPDHGTVGREDIIPYPFKLPKSETKPKCFFDLRIESIRCDLAAIIKHLYARLNKIVLDVLCGNARVLGEALKSRVKVKKQQNFSQVK